MDTIGFVFQGLIPVFIFFTVSYGFAKGVPVYDSFVSGAKDGIGIIIGIFPYVLAVYLGSVGIKKTKYLVPVCLAADMTGIIIAIILVKLMF